MSKDAPALAHALERAGFVEEGGPPLEAQRDFTKDGEEVQIALLALNQRGQVVVAGGPAAGTPWPEGMLASPGGRIGDVECPIVNPRVQVEIKEKFPVWRPDLPPRAKHQADIARLRDAFAHSSASSGKRPISEIVGVFSTGERRTSEDDKVLLREIRYGDELDEHPY